MAHIVSDRDVIRNVLQDVDRYTAYLGAGVSVEADVSGAEAICREVRRLILESGEAVDGPALDAALSWDDPKRRYSACLQKYGNAAQRVQFFRRLLRGKEPSFAHHAVALLTARRIFRSTCLTTNFDKLLEVAFARQGEVECQAIRVDEETVYWGAETDKCYVVKLHGDYDTHNILNTRDETMEIEPELVSVVENLAQDCGMVVLGAAGNEDSVQRLFDRLTSPKAPRKRLSMGLYWGVFVGAVRPEVVSADDATRLVNQAIKNGAVSKEVVEMMARASSKDRPCAFFPVWGAGNFLFSLIQASGQRSLIGTSTRYLDHDMRLRHVFARAGLRPDAVDAHLKALDAQRRRLKANERDEAPPEHIWSARAETRRMAVRVLYGDIASRSLMGDMPYADVRRAIVSPDDTCISAGGGVAYRILTKAGPHGLLNELGKLAPIAQREVAVTSGGNLPVHYILHAAAISIQPDASAAVTADDVEHTVAAALSACALLNVQMVLVPLIAAGLGPLTPQQSLDAILRAVAAQGVAAHELTVQIVVYQERQLGRHDIGASLRATLGDDFVVQAEGG